MAQVLFLVEHLTFRPTLMTQLQRRQLFEFYSPEIFWSIEGFLILYHSDYINNFRWHISSNALLKSSSILSICSPLFNDFAWSFTVLINCVSQDRCFLRPCCRSVRMLLLPKSFMILLHDITM